MISVSTSGSTKSTEKFLRTMERLDIVEILHIGGQMGVHALMAAIPIDTGKAALSWYYQIEYTKNRVSIVWYNSDINHGFPIAIMLQYGHGTGGGGYVQGRDYINPAMRPVFDRIQDYIWKAVTSA